jgi:GTP pyrophosphokinase
MNPNFEQTYNAVYRPKFLAFVPRLVSLVDDLLHTTGISFAQIDSRVKTTESFLHKIERKAYDDPFREVKDLAGIRVVTYYQDDVLRVAEMFRSEFHVDEDESSDKLEELDVSEFGYRSFHLVCSLGEKRRSLVEWQAFDNLSFEVQVRSVLQHAWASISHKLDYKRIQDAPSELRRQLFRLSALLELADDQFSVLRDHSIAIGRQYKQSFDRGELQMPINVDSLENYFRHVLDHDEWESLGLAAGFSNSKPESGDNERTLHALNGVLQHLGFATIEDLNTFLMQHKHKANYIFKEVAVAAQVQRAHFEANPYEMVLILVAIMEKARLPFDYTWPSFYRTEMRKVMNRLLDQQHEA